MIISFRAGTNAILCFSLLITLVGCGAKRLSADFDRLPVSGPMKFEVSDVRDNTGKTYDIDVASMFAASLSDALAKGNLLAASGEDRLLISADILDYERGNAFKRWLLPGWGSTVLHVRCEVRRASAAALAQPAGGSSLPAVGSGPSGLGSVEARRTVSFGGAYSVGAWRTIFDRVSTDVADEIKKQRR